MLLTPLIKRKFAMSVTAQPELPTTFNDALVGTIKTMMINMRMYLYDMI